MFAEHCVEMEMKAISRARHKQRAVSPRSGTIDNTNKVASRLERKSVASNPDSEKSVDSQDHSDKKNGIDVDSSTSKERAEVGGS